MTEPREIMVREHWHEVRVTGQPPSGYPPYDFVFRSDDPDLWEKRHVIIDRALNDWPDVKVERRAVARWTWTSSWHDGEQYAPPHDEVAAAIKAYEDERFEERAVWMRGQR